MENAKSPWYYLVLLILAGESVFILPFVLSRVFRPTVLQTFELDNVQLGYCFAMYGIVALFSYLLGGPVADRFQPNKLMATALWLTALGGVYYATFPAYVQLKVLYGYWGFTTIFLFWSPMIKATRIWGGEKSQGKAFGILDGGRGLVGALFGVLGVWIFSWVVQGELNELSLIDKQTAFQYVILICSGIVLLVGVLVWLFMGMDKETVSKVTIEKMDRHQILTVLKLPAVWLLMIIICCAYVGYKITDDFSLYAEDVLGYNAVESAQIGTFLLFIRPVIGVLIGILADRSKPVQWLTLSFILTVFGAFLFALGWVQPTSIYLFFVSILIVAAGVYAARSLYFAVMQSGGVPVALTGTAVGLISVIGFTPDIFAGPLMGYFLDVYPGIRGHQSVFWMLAIFASIGGVTAFIYDRKRGKN